MVSAGLTGEYRVVQVHPTLRCNLRCHHWYSVSGPAEHGALGLDVLTATVAELSAEGYNGLGVSGGEPLLYDGLTALLEAAKACAMVTTVTTNGMLLTVARAASLAGLVDLIAVSVDGTEASHARIRGSRHAFPGMRRGLAVLRDAGLDFGIIFTLTMTNLDELAAVVNFAIAEGAGLVQVHPLEEVGRAGDDLPGAAPDDRELAYAFLEVGRLRAQYGGDVSIQLDVADRDVLRERPWLGFAGPSDASGAGDQAGAALARVVAPLVIESDGTIVPVQHGFDRRFAIGRVTQERFQDAAARWRLLHQDRFVALCRDVYEREVLAPQDLPFFNWYSAVTQASLSFAA